MSWTLQCLICEALSFEGVFCVLGHGSAAGAARVVFCSRMQPRRAWGIWIGRGVMEL